MSIAAIPETYATAWTCLFRNIRSPRGSPREELGISINCGHQLKKLLGRVR
jgi:hypothetical protein